MAGEINIRDWSGDNVGLLNVTVPGVCLDIDAANSSNLVTAIKLAGIATEVIGVAYDQSKLNPDGTVAGSSGIAVRTWGVAKVTCSAAITAGAYVKVSTAAGFVAASTQALAGAQPAAIVGRALNSTSGSGDLCLVLLMIGARY